MNQEYAEARNRMLDSMADVADVVAVYAGIRTQFESAGWPREMANQIVVDMFHKANCCRCRGGGA